MGGDHARPPQCSILKPLRSHIAFLLSVNLALIASVVGCDSSIQGALLENKPPETQLSIQDESLLDNFEEGDRLISTVRVTWFGDDSDGFVSGYEVRFFVESLGDSQAEWQFTGQTDSLFLLPILPGEIISDVVFEVRAIDNESLADPTPARTIFPIENSPPEIKLSLFDLPPDTTFNVISFAWTASDPDGENNLKQIDISLNDSLNFTAIPPEVDFLTLLVDSVSPGTVGETNARVFLGRGFESTGINMSGMKLNEVNTLYLRSVDQTDTTSTRIEFSWYMKAKTADVLYVNDYRRAANSVIRAGHLNILSDFMPIGMPIDIWNITTPFVTGTSGNTPRSGLLPPNVQPTLEQFFAGYSYIYWVTSASTDRIATNNLPFAAPVMDLFFANGGKLMVHSLIGMPPDPTQILENAAAVMMPMTDLVTFPDSLRPSLRLATGGVISAGGRTLPSTSQPLPELKSAAFLVNTLPFVATGSNIIPLYEADYRYVTRLGSRQGPWFGSSVVASLSADQRIGLFALPLFNDQTGASLITGANGDDADVELALNLILESLGFPKR